jgi:hypothetical protein
MNPKAKRRWIFVLLITSFGVATWFIGKLLRPFAYKVSEFSGDGRIVDSGVWSYPRYRLKFPEIVVAESKGYAFSFRGAPPETFTLGLELVDPAQSNALEAVKQRVTIGLRLQDKQSRVLCELHSNLADWRRSWSQTKVLYWHEHCRDFVLSSHRTYSLTLTVEPSDRDLPAVLLVPILEGGGNEMP